uniref:Uncharacterized protein n=1 Tax=Anolis carolinensis TaxID=28377 RepID=R4GAR8_ANOCA
MSSRSPRKRLQAEATCPSCLEYFIDPMILDCGHNLCFRCISHIWRNPQVMARCPQCTAMVHRQNFKANLQLANMVEIARALGKQLKVERDGGKCCKKHQEALKLFCKDDKIPICLVCDRSKQHIKHHVVPVEEVDQEYQIWNCLETLREERDKILAYKTLMEKESQDLLDIGNALERCRNWKLENPVVVAPELKWCIWDICDITPYLKNVIEQFKDHLKSGFRLQKENLHFDPLTSGPWVVLSADCKTVTEGDQYRALSNNPESIYIPSFSPGRGHRADHRTQQTFNAVLYT